MFLPVHSLDNMRWRLTDWLRPRGTLSLGENYLATEIASLGKWEREVLLPWEQGQR